MKRVGILGAGQLGCLLAESLFQYGAEVFFYDTQPRAPGFFRTPHYTCGDWMDEKKLSEFFSSCDVVTYEFENVSVELLQSLVAKTKTPLYPSAHALLTTQNRIFEKTFLKENALPVCSFAPIYNLDNLNKVLTTKPFPFIIKTATGGYDGKGQWRINHKNDAENVFKEIKAILDKKDKDFSPAFIYEELISIQQELSCITGRNSRGELVFFPVFENEHQNHILHRTFLPANISYKLEKKIQLISQQACEKLNLVGLLTTEFFLTHNNKIFVNEFAPRPHNSGHISRIACSLSQYNILARILLDLPLHKPELFNDSYIMENMLGDIWIEQGQEKNISLNAWKNNSNVNEIVLYGKENPQPKRKMGHFIVSHFSRLEASRVCDNFRKELMNDKK